jgi:hypothetical protein
MTGRPLFISFESRSVILPLWYAYAVAGSGLLDILALIALAALSCPAGRKQYCHYLFRGPMTITRLKDIAGVNKICNNPQAGLACAIRMDGVCNIFMVSDDMIRSRRPDPEDVKRHEMAHCNGWPAHHPGARFVGSKGDRI